MHKEKCLCSSLATPWLSHSQNAVSAAGRENNTSGTAAFTKRAVFVTGSGGLNPARNGRPPHDEVQKQLVRSLLKIFAKFMQMF